MKNILTFITFLLSILTINGQDIAEICAVYTYTYPNYKEEGKMKTKEMTLLANSTDSKWFNRMSEYWDSMCSTPQGRKQLQDIQFAAWVEFGADGSISVNKNNNAPEKQVYQYIYTNSQELSVYDKLGEQMSTYTEPYQEMEWEIVSDSTLNILGFECMMATTSYHGRDWKVWFTLDVPVMFGPWKLRGLPGLILKADANGGFAFEAKEVGRISERMLPIYPGVNYEKVDRKKALADHQYLMSHLESIRSASAGIALPPGFKEPEYLPKHAIECDY